MSPYEVFLLPEAEAELAAAFDWYLKRSEQAAEAFRAEAVNAIDSLSETPTQWKLNEDGSRRLLLRHFPYTVHFDSNRLDPPLWGAAFDRAMAAARLRGLGVVAVKDG